MIYIYITITYKRNYKSFNRWKGYIPLTDDILNCEMINLLELTQVNLASVNQSRNKRVNNFFKVYTYVYVHFKVTILIINICILHSYITLKCYFFSICHNV